MRSILLLGALCAHMAAPISSVFFVNIPQFTIITKDLLFQYFLLKFPRIFRRTWIVVLIIHCSINHNFPNTCFQFADFTQRQIPRRWRSKWQKRNMSEDISEANFNPQSISEPHSAMPLLLSMFNLSQIKCPMPGAPWSIRVKILRNNFQAQKSHAICVIITHF